MYQNLFNRAPDAANLAKIQGWVDANPDATLDDLAQALSEIPEFKAQFEGLDAEAKAEQMLTHFSLAKGTTGGDLAYNYFLEQLNAGVDEATLLKSAVEYLDNTDETTLTEQGLDTACLALENKVAVAEYYAVEKQVVAETFDDLKAVVANVTDDAATVTATKAVIEQNLPATFALTTGTDTLTGGDVDDTFTAINSSLNSEGTLQGADSIDGGAGNDTINISMKQDFDGFTTGSMKNVENVVLTNDSTAALTFAAKNVTGVKSYTIDSTKASISVTNVDSLADLSVKGPANASTFSFEYNATSDVATGTQTDVQNLTVENVGTIDSDGVASTTNADPMTVKIANVETLDLITKGTANTLKLAGVSNATTINVSGEGQTEIQDVDAAMTAFDASQATGNVIATLTNVAVSSLKTIKTGSGDDVVTVSLDDLTTTPTIAMGDGTDKLVSNATPGKTVQATMSGVQTLEFDDVDNIDGDVTFSMANVSDLTTLSLASGGTIGGDVNIVNIGSQDFTVNTTGAIGQGTPEEYVLLDNTGKATVNLNSTATATDSEVNALDFQLNGASSVEINVGEYVIAKNKIETTSTGDVTLNIASKVVDNAEKSGFIAVTAGTDGKLVADSASSVTVNAQGALTDADIEVAKATTVSITAGSTGAATLYQLAAEKATTLNLTVGAKGLDMDGAGATNLGKVQTITATNKGDLDFTDVALPEAASLTFTGSGDSPFRY